MRVPLVLYNLVCIMSILHTSHESEEFYFRDLFAEMGDDTRKSVCQIRCAVVRDVIFFERHLLYPNFPSGNR